MQYLITLSEKKTRVCGLRFSAYILLVESNDVRTQGMCICWFELSRMKTKVFCCRLILVPPPSAETAAISPDFPLS